MSVAIPDWLARRAALHPARPAIISTAATWSFAELDARAAALAARLRALGLARGARLAILARNCAEYAVALHAAPRIGAILVPLNTRLSPGELAWQLADCGAALLLYDEQHADVAAGMGAVQIAALEDMAAEAAADTLQPVSFQLDAAHTIIYTSGTTGRPKGAMLSIGNHWWSATASALNLGLYEDDRWLAVLPLFHVGGLAILLRGAIYGMPVVLHERFAPTAVLGALEHDGVTIASLVAVMLQGILEAAGDVALPPHFRCALLGGGPAPLPLLTACAARGLPVVQTYGLTESASQAVTLAPADALRKLGSAGQPLLPLELCISVEGREAAPDELGEICLRGPMITSGYYNRPEASAAALRAGWLHTGDLGYCDREGFLYVVDRRDDLIISGGENVYPAEVEAALLAHAGVAEAGVVGAPDPRWGQAPVAFVVMRTGAVASSEELITHCRGVLATYKVPRSISFVAELPRTAAGKLRRSALRELLSET